MLQPEIWKQAVDIAQIISALGTVGAVIAALHLARRSEKQRPKLHIGFNQTIVLHSEYAEAAHIFEVVTTVVNAGVLPFWVKSATFHVPTQSVIWGSGARGNFELQHGRQESYPHRITADRHWIDAEKQLGWLFRNRPYYSITTSLGNRYKRRMTFRQVRSLKKMIRATASGNFSGTFE